MMSLVSALEVLVVGSLGICPIILARFIISVTVPILVVLTWGIAIVQMVILMMSLVWAIFLSVSDASVSMVNTFKRFVVDATTWPLGFYSFLGFLPSKRVEKMPMQKSALWQPSKKSWRVSISVLTSPYF